MTIALSHLKKAMRFITTRGPKYATFFVNTQCNRACTYCIVSRRQNLEIPSQTWNTITDRVVSYGVCLISIVGGEPTLRKDLANIIKYASRKVIVNLTSNGDTFVTTSGRDYLNFLASVGLSSLTISLHELGDLERQLKTLLLAKKLRIVPVLAAVATKASIEYLPEVMKVTNKYGIFFRYSLCQTVGGDFSPAIADLQPTSEQISSFTNIVHQQKQHTGLVINTHEYLQKASLYPNSWHCDSYKDYWVHVNSDGTLMACSERPTPIKATDILSLGDPRWVETRTAIRLKCSGCTNHCYVEQEKINGFTLIREGSRQAIALFRTKGNL